MSAIIFDFDGTIADSFDLVLDLFYELTRHPRFSPERIAELRRVASLRKVAKAVNLTPRQVPMLLIKGRTQMARRLHEVEPFSGIQEALDELQREGHQLFVMSSNSKRNVDDFLKTHRLVDYFDGVYGGVGLLSKAAALNKVMRQNKLQASQCYYVGDEVRDVLAARRARIRSIAVGWGYNDATVLADAKPFALIKSPKELPKALAGKGIVSGVLVPTVLMPTRLFRLRRKR